MDHIKWADGFILVFSITDYWSLYEVARLASVISRTREDEKPPIVVFSNKIDMEKQRQISRNEASQFLNDLNKPVFRTSAADNYDSVRKAFDEASRLIYKWKFPSPERKPRSRSGSFMDPLREAFTKHIKSMSGEVLPQRPRSASSADIDVRKANSLAHVGIINHDNKMEQFKSGKKNSISGNFLQIPLDEGQGPMRTRSHSFA